MSMSSALGELAADASLERNAFLATAGEQLRKFLAANKDRIKEVGGLVLIELQPDANLDDVRAKTGAPFEVALKN